MKHFSQLALIGISFLLLETVNANELQKARSLNTVGYGLYQQKNYKDAYSRFQAAIELDPNYALAHYNLACVIPYLIENWCDQNRDVRFTEEEVRKHLEKATQLDPKRKIKMKGDSDLKKFQGRPWFKTMTGSSIIEVLTSTEWIGFCTDFYGGKPNLFFKPGGLLKYVTLENKEIEGKYTIKGSTVKIELSSPLDQRANFEGSLEDYGLNIPNLGHGYFTNDCGCG